MPASDAIHARRVTFVRHTKAPKCRITYHIESMESRYFAYELVSIDKQDRQDKSKFVLEPGREQPLFI